MDRFATSSSSAAAAAAATAGTGTGAVDMLLGSSAMAFSVEEALQGRGRWRNISDVVRESMAAAFEIIRKQSAQIAALQAAMTTQQALTEQVLARCRTEFASSAAVARQHEDLMAELGSKVSRTDLAAALQSHTQRGTTQLDTAVREIRTAERDVEALKRTVGDLQSLLQHKANSSELHQFARVTDLALKADITDVNSALSLKANKDAVEHALSQKAALVAVDDLQRRVVLCPTKVEVVDFVEEQLQKLQALVQAVQADLAAQAAAEQPKFALVDEMHAALATKVDRTEVSAIQRKMVTQQMMDQRVSKLSEDITRQVSNDVHVMVKETHAELVTVLNKKAYKADVAKSLQKKIDREEVEALLATKAEASAVAQALRKKADVSDVSATRAAMGAMDTALGTTGSSTLSATTLDRLERELQLRVTRPEVDAAIDAKLVVWTESKLSGLLNGPKPAQEVAAALEGTCGRWVWKSHRLAARGTIPWEVQVVNTAPAALLWNAASDTVVTVRGGLYQITGGFFASSPPRVTVLVNGEPVVSCPASDTLDTVQHHAHPAGIISGTSLHQFLTLPPNAELCVVFDGRGLGQGFFAVQKL